MLKTKHSFQMMLASLLLVTVLAGCGAETKGGPESGSSVQPSAAVTATPSDNGSTGGTGGETRPETSNAPTEEQRDAIIYSSSSELEGMVERTVTLKGTTDEDFVKAAFAELQKEVDGSGVSLWKGVHVLSSELKEGKFTVDLHIPDEARLGAPGELQMIETMKSTIFQFPFVEEIELLVVGEAVESLMGHVELDHPIKR
ncbi:GerMN domain-containing protein [Paenibacillus sp. GCM10027627]|uniref:GerMN domain-containing protein n=1 Tax=unclassified Paenibacillus TaxID=185978 RepID=UPI003628F970